MIIWCKYFKNFHLLYAFVEIIARFRIAVVQKVMLCHDQLFKVAERLFWVESHEEYWQCQIVLGDQEVLRVVNEDGVLERGVQVQVDMMIFRTRVPVKMKSVTTTKHH